MRSLILEKAEGRVEYASVPEDEEIGSRLFFGMLVQIFFCVLYQVFLLLAFVLGSHFEHHACA